MAERLLGDILGQSSNATSGGLLGGPSIFQTQPSRGQRRSALLSQAISSQGSNPYARLGAAFGGLIGMGGRAAGEGLGILQEPEQVRRSRLITEAQQAAAESGVDPVSEPDRFLEVIDPIVESDPLLKSGIRSQIIRLQRELAPDPRNAIELEQARLELAQTKQEADKNAQALEMNRVLPELNQSFSSISELDISERLPALVELEQRASSVTTSQGKEFLDKVRKRRQEIQDELESEASDNNVTNGSVRLTDQGSKYIGEKNGTLVEVTAEGVVPFTGQFVESQDDPPIPTGLKDADRELFESVLSINSDLQEKFDKTVEKPKFFGLVDGDEKERKTVLFDRAYNIRRANPDLTAEEALEIAVNRVTENFENTDTPDSQPGIATPEKDEFAGALNP